LGVLVGYVQPKDPTGRKDVVQAFALILAGVVGLIGGMVGIVNVSVARRNLRQQIELEEQRHRSARELEHERSEIARETTLEQENQRSQDAALQAYFEQMGDLLTDHDLIDTERRAVRQLARAQTRTVLARLDGLRKGLLIRFLHGARLMDEGKPIVALAGASLTYVNLRGADLRGASLRGTYLTGADLSSAYLRGADLRDAYLTGADLSSADLSSAKVTEEQLVTCKHLQGVTMPNGQKYEDWLKNKSSGEDGENSGPS
jgi:hypothetical protein